jgi:hypothetical protein
MEPPFNLSKRDSIKQKKAERRSSKFVHPILQEKQGNSKVAPNKT